jgi:hypothetical protein
VRDSCSDRKDENNRHRRQQDDGFEALSQRRSFNRFKKLRLTLRWRDRFFSVSECDGFQGVQWVAATPSFLSPNHHYLAIL